MVKNKLTLEPADNVGNLKTDPDEQWSNLYREREKNNLYKWVGMRTGGDLIAAYERDGNEGVLRFAEEKLAPMMYEDGDKPQLIKYADYLKWKKTVNVQLGRIDEPIETDHNNKSSSFPEHAAQWRLNKRGVQGETIIHLLLSRPETACGEIARALIRRYPGLANDICLGKEMFGESPLHLAIVHNDYATVQLLLQCAINVNANACGQFFMPEQYLKKANVDYHGYAYYGEYPLAFAACFGNKDIYDLLIQYGADPNRQDMFGNAVLHLCVINNNSSMYSYAVRHWAKPADPHIVNLAGYTPLTLAAKLGRKKIFEEMLELGKVEFWRFSDMTCSAYPLTTLDTIRPDGSTNYNSALMTVITGNTAEHLDMIGSEVIQRLLADKWKAFAQRKLYERLGLLILHLVTMCGAAYLRPSDADSLYLRVVHKNVTNSTTNTTTTVTSGPNPVDWLRFFCELCTVCNCLFFVFVQQFGDFKILGFYGYFRNLATAPAKVVFLLANLCILACIPCRLLQFSDMEDAMIVFALPGSWIFLLFFARTMKLTGPFVQMIYSMIAGDMIRFAAISAIFLLAFSQIFYFVGNDISDKQNLHPNDIQFCNVTSQLTSGNVSDSYSSLLETFMTLVRASMGGFDVSMGYFCCICALQYEEFSCANYQLLTKAFFVLYLFVVLIMMINILIAMMGNTYVTIIAQAEKAWQQQFAQIIMVLERSVHKDKLARCQLEYSIKLNNDGGAMEEVRGLMVIKQTKKTRAKQRKQAIFNWKLIGRKVIEVVDKFGTHEAQLILHSHERVPDELMAGSIAHSRTPNATRRSSPGKQSPVPVHHHQIESKPQLLQGELPSDGHMVQQFARTVLGDELQEVRREQRRFRHISTLLPFIDVPNMPAPSHSATAAAIQMPPTRDINRRKISPAARP